MFGHTLNHQTTISSSDNRTDQRHAIHLHAVIINEDCRPETIEILNIARLGFLAKATRPRETGEAIELEIDLIGACQAHVVWSNSDQFGGRFVEPIDMTPLF